MAENVKLPARSNNGCWTCRLRRKKCDEARPFCSPCMALELECHGYGPRPVWMDNGILQKTQAEAFKRLVSRGISKKGRRHLQPKSQGNATFPNGIRSSSTESSGSPIDLFQLTSDAHSSHNLEEELQWYDGQSTGFSTLDLTNHVRSSEAPSSNLFVHDIGSALQDELQSRDNMWESDTLQLTDHLAPSSAPSDQISQGFGAFADYEHISRLECDRDTYRDWFSSNETPMEPYLGLEHLHDTPSSSQHQHTSQRQLSSRILEGSIDSPATFHTGSSREDFWAPVITSTRSTSSLSDVRRHMLASSPESSVSNVNTEDTLFMHYLDQVFYIQYPFYHFQNREGRGWILAILRRTKSAYHAALALSERHLLPLSLDKEDIAMSMVQLRTENSHYELALRKLQTMILEFHAFSGPAAVKPSLEILMTLLQLFFFEITNDGREKWHAHLRTASRFITLLVQEHMAIRRSSLTGSEFHDEKRKSTPFCPEVDAALKFLVGSFIIFDIIAAASTRSAPVLSINHASVMDDLGISLEPLVSLQNSVMGLLMEVVALDRWKNEARNASQLSVVALAKRGDTLQERLRQELAATETPLPTLALYNSARTPIPAPSTHPIINKIFLLATITYLNVVVSGPYPAVPEIANSVAETIAAIRSMQDASLLRHLIWPLCISGCLASEEYYDFFRDLMTREDVAPSHSGTCLEAFGIMQDCWKARASSDADCDWASTMKRRGCYVYLG